MKLRFFLIRQRMIPPTPPCLLSSFDSGRGLFLPGQARVSGKCRTRFSDYEFLAPRCRFFTAHERFGRLRRIGVITPQRQPFSRNPYASSRNRQGSWERTDLLYCADYPSLISNTGLMDKEKPERLPRLTRPPLLRYLVWVWPQRPRCGLQRVKSGQYFLFLSPFRAHLAASNARNLRPSKPSRIVDRYVCPRDRFAAKEALRTWRCPRT